jgi:hypothetical protein
LPLIILTSEDYSNPPSTDGGKELVHDRSNKRSTPLPPPSHGTINPVTAESFQLNEPTFVLNFPIDLSEDASVNANVKPRCWDHGCEGREFSSKSNFIRHKKEKDGEAAKVTCPLCGGIFTRTSARDTHLAKQSCHRIRRYSNGRPRPSKIALLSSLNLGQDTHY